MLTIRNQQLATFRARNGGSLEELLVRHLHEFTPYHAKVLGNQGLSAVIRHGIERSENYGFTMRGPSRFYVETMFMFGSEFDTDPQYPWASNTLSANGDQVERADALHAEVMSYVAAVRGPNVLQRALQRARVTLERPLPCYEGRFHDLLIAWARAVYPEKFQFVGEAALRNLAQHNQRRHRYLGFDDEPAVFLIFVLSYFFGHGFALDPLHPWISASLRLAEPAERVRRLVGETKSRLARVTANIDSLA